MSETITSLDSHRQKQQDWYFIMHALRRNSRLLRYRTGWFFLVFFFSFLYEQNKIKKNRNILPLRVHYFKFIHHCATEAKKVTRPRDVCEATISSSFFFSQLLSKHTHFLNYLKSTFFLCVCVYTHKRRRDDERRETHFPPSMVYR